MTEDPRMAWEEALIADIREHDGRPTSGPLAGHPLLVMYSTGARSGERRRAVLTYSRDGDAFIVTGSASGAPHDPAWIANVTAHPDVTVEIGRDAFEAIASVVDGSEQVRLWDRACRRSPVVRGLSRAGSPDHPRGPSDAADRRTSRRRAADHERAHRRPGVGRAGRPRVLVSCGAPSLGREGYSVGVLASTASRMAFLIRRLVPHGELTGHLDA